MPAPTSHPRDPLHGITLATIVQHLVDRHGWDVMARRIPIRCFMFDPSVTSSLKFLRKTPWARQKVEGWFISELPPHPLTELHRAAPARTATESKPVVDSVLPELKADDATGDDAPKLLK